MFRSDDPLTDFREFPTRMVYLDYISRVSDQNGVSRLYIEGSRPEWCISTIYRGFPTRMVYLDYISRVPTRMVYLDYISRVPDQSGVCRLYIEGSRPEWCISTVGAPDQNGVSRLYIEGSDQNGVSRLHNYHCRDTPFLLETLVVQS